MFEWYNKLKYLPAGLIITYATGLKDEKKAMTIGKRI
jgi:hypothetical protein